MSWFTKWRNRKVGTIDTKSIQSIHSSDESMSGSRLNIALMDMLNLPKSTLFHKCTGNPRLRATLCMPIFKPVAVILLPFAIMLGLSLWRGIKDVNDYKVLMETNRREIFGKDLGTAIRALQEERDLSVFYSTTFTLETKQSLLKTYAMSNEAIYNLSFWTETEQNLPSEYTSRESFIGFLNQHRYSLEINKPTVQEELLFYKGTIYNFFHYITRIFYKLEILAFWKDAISYQSALNAIVYLGEEQIHGAIFYLQGNFSSRKEYLDYVKSRDIGINSFDTAIKYSSHFRYLYQKYNNGTDSYLHSITTMRKFIRSNFDEQTVPSLENAKMWMRNMSSYLDLITTMQVDLSAIILKQEEEEKDEKWFDSILNLCAVIVMSVIYLFVIIVICFYRRSMQTYSTFLADRTKAVRKEKRRTNIVLQQMMPMPVARMYCRKETVNPEEFRTASLMLSEMVDFNKLSMRSSPYHVVSMLNKLYGCYDELIARYDAFKVETGSEIYLITSGLAHRNTNSAREIGLLALDMIRHANQMDIPHYPGTPYSLRIGCHTGPVMAGVVGSSMPKYCVFGKTVDVASRIQALGFRNKVHISKEMYESLKDSGSFVIELRSDDGAKNDSTLKDLLGDSIVTYWLLGNSSMASLSSLGSASLISEANSL